MPFNITHHPRVRGTHFIIISKGNLLVHSQTFMAFGLVLPILSRSGRHLCDCPSKQAGAALERRWGGRCRAGVWKVAPGMSPQKVAGGCSLYLPAPPWPPQVWVTLVLPLEPEGLGPGDGSGAAAPVSESNPAARWVRDPHEFPEPPGPWGFSLEPGIRAPSSGAL